MSQPHGFSWIEKPSLAAMARPEGLDELLWLRAQGIEVLLSLTEDPPRRDWVNEAGLMQVHVPIVDMEAPTQEQLRQCLATIARANAAGMGVGLHCGARAVNMASLNGAGSTGGGPAGGPVRGGPLPRAAR